MDNESITLITLNLSSNISKTGEKIIKNNNIEIENSKIDESSIFVLNKVIQNNLKLFDQENENQVKKLNDFEKEKIKIIVDNNLEQYFIIEKDQQSNTLRNKKFLTIEKTTISEVYILCDLAKWFKFKDWKEKIIPLMNGSQGISLRLLDCMITNFCQDFPIFLKLNEKNMDENIFLLKESYKNQLERFSKKKFDPFARGQRIRFFPKDIPKEYQNNLDYTIVTTIGQLNFLKWALEYNIIHFAIENKSVIERYMKNIYQKISIHENIDEKNFSSENKNKKRKNKTENQNRKYIKKSKNKNIENKFPKITKKKKEKKNQKILDKSLLKSKLEKREIIKKYDTVLNSIVKKNTVPIFVSQNPQKFKI